jgi:peptide/nickel transport system substrate-binding protein
LLLAVLITVGCGGAGSNTPPETLNVALMADPPSLDPSLSSGQVDRQVMASLYDKLVDIDQNGEIVLMLAESYEVSDDETEYTFMLREDVTFHDGEPFDAEAVKFNLDRYREDESARNTEVSSIEDVEAVDPSTVRVTLSEPFSPFLSVLTDRAGMMVSPAAVEEAGSDVSTNPVGTGPFRFVERVRGDNVTVERNPDYWQEGLPLLETVIYRGVPDENVQLQNLRSGELDVIDEVPSVEMNGLKDDAEFPLSDRPSLGYQGIHLNTTRPPFDEELLRRAVYTLTDRDAVAAAALQGAGGVPGNSPFGPQSLAYGASDEYEGPNVEEATALLEEAGRPDGFTFTLKIGTQPEQQLIGQVVQNIMRQAGIDVRLQRVEFGELLDQAGNKDFEALYLGWSGRVDPDQNIYDNLVSGSDRNYPGYSNEEVDRLLDEARTEGDSGRRKEIYDQVMEILHEEVPYVYLFHQIDDYAFQPSVEGFTAYPDGILRVAELSKRDEGEG